MGEGRRYLLRTYAKLNLCLDVIERLNDGYHRIESLFQNISMHDELEVLIQTGRGRFRVEANVRLEGNLLVRVWDLLKVSDLDCAIKLSKNIPVGAGLGGGSSNAGGFLALLRNIGYVSEGFALEVAKKVGSDVPFFLRGGTAVVKGRGDVVEYLPPLKDIEVDVFFPGFSVLTKEAYAKLDPSHFGRAPLQPLELYYAYVAGDWEKLRLGTYNVFETIIPESLRLEIERLRSVWPAALTGSGSAYFCVRPGGSFQFVATAFELVV